MKDPYVALGLTKTASQTEIKSAYRKLAKKYHPDANPGDKSAEAKFKEISSAYAIIGDPEKRKDFDEGRIDSEGMKRHQEDFSRAWQNSDGFRGTFRSGEFSPDDIFSEIFSGFGRRRGPIKHRGADVTYSIRVAFKDAALGTKRPLTLTGGKIVNITVPEGTDDGTQLRLKGQGQQGLNGGENGDALIDVHVDPHKFFTRSGLDIYLDVPIRIDEAVLGATITVPTLSGLVNLKIPAGSTTGTTLRIKGKGIKNGDQYVKLKVDTPKDPDSKLQEFLQKWGKTQNDDPRKSAGLI